MTDGKELLEKLTKKLESYNKTKPLHEEQIQDIIASIHYITGYKITRQEVIYHHEQRNKQNDRKENNRGKKTKDERDTTARD